MEEKELRIVATLASLTFSCFRIKEVSGAPHSMLGLSLRLGQEKFNMEYANALKACFTIPQSVGVIGGRPRHALWLIGCNGKIIV